MKRFGETVTFITGASSGIGAALALEIARQGGDVVLMARRKERLQELGQKQTLNLTGSITLLPTRGSALRDASKS
jgi:NADP-dependent 3-hydroxy acid dehydrogenase YdfG